MKGIIPIMMAMSGMTSRLKDELEGIDIKKEYELIKQKKSRLSANIRRKIVYRYEKNKED